MTTETNIITTPEWLAARQAAIAAGGRPPRKPRRKKTAAFKGGAEVNEFGDYVRESAKAASDVTVRDEWDSIALEIAALKPLLRVIERHLEFLDCTDRMDDLTAGDVSMLAALAYRRLAELDARMSAARPDWP